MRGQKKGFRHSPESIKKMSETKRSKHHHPTEEQRKQKSEAFKGSKNPHFGKHHSEEMRKLISEKTKEQMKDPEVRERFLRAIELRSQNEEWRRNISLSKTPELIKNVSMANLQKCSTPEARKNQSKSQKKRFSNKNNHPNYGVPMSNAQKKKISVSRTGIKLTPFTEEHKRKIGESNKGRIVSEDTKNKIRGENNSQWKGGVSTLYILIRNCAMYYKWRNAVFERDNYRDWFSGIKGNGNLNAHHIVPFIKLLEANDIKTIEDAARCKALWDINNGITIIESSHDAHHQMWEGY